MTVPRRGPRSLSISRGNGEYAQPVGILQRDGEAQDRKMPRPYRPGVPFIWSVAQIHAGHD